MFFNQMVFISDDKHRQNPQISYQFHNAPYLLGNEINFFPAINTRQQIITPIQPPKTGWVTASEILGNLALGALIGGAFVLTAIAVFELIRPRRNSVPLTPGMRRFIRERDEETCFYCGNYAPDGHVDHRISRNNNGSNEPENLTWACIFCNCSKGALNDNEYITLLQECY
ncbi:MAG TPA: HNH endonuclease signature motif containing protein [Pyrinomonadaceae bacterium]|nr:HNH endonuclease signature motif containing protein [Pyrinomonadaceae bacterium]